MTNLGNLAEPERRSVYQLITTYETGQTVARTCETFRELSAAIDEAWAAGFIRYQVRPAGER